MLETLEELSLSDALLSPVEVSLGAVSVVESLLPKEDETELSEEDGKTQPLSKAAKERKVAILLFLRFFMKDAYGFTNDEQSGHGRHFPKLISARTTS